MGSDKELCCWRYLAAVIRQTLLHYSLSDIRILLTLELIKWTTICPEPAQKSIPLCQLFNTMNASPQRFCTKYVDRLSINNCSIRVTVLDRDTHLVDKFWRTLIFIHCIWIMLTFCFFCLHDIASTTTLKTVLYMTTWKTQIISLTSVFYTCYMCGYFKAHRITVSRIFFSFNIVACTTAINPCTEN